MRGHHTGKKWELSKWLLSTAQALELRDKTTVTFLQAETGINDRLTAR